MQKKHILAIMLTFMSTCLFARINQINAHTEDLTKRLVIPNEKYVLPNGLTVILSEDHSTPFVAVSLWYQVGSVHEDLKNNKTGLAHLFEHLMFEGSRHVLPSEHFKRLEAAGAIDVNASTSFDRTNYFQTVPKNYLELALALEASRMSFLVVEQTKLDEQRAVVRREREQRFEVAPYGVTTLTLWEKVFPKNNPLHGRVIGSHKDLENAKVADVQSFYDRFYGPTNASLTLVGDFDKNNIKDMINKYFGTLPKSTLQVTPKIAPVVLKNEEILTLDEKIGKVPLVRIQYVTPALFQSGDAELDVLSNILTGSESGRLTRAVTRDKLLASTVAAYQQSLEQTSFFTIDAVLNPGVNAKDLIAEIDNVLAALVTNAPSDTEINRARNTILTDQLFGLQDLGGYAGRAELLQTYNRFAKTPDYIQEDVKRYQSLDAKALQRAAAQYLPVKTARKILIATPVLNHVAQKGN